MMNQRKTGKRRILVVILCAVLVLSFVAITSVAGLWSGDSDSAAMLGDSGEISLGESEEGERPDGDINLPPGSEEDPTLGESGEVSVEIREEGTLEEGNLRLVLTIEGEVYQVEMIAPTGEIEEKEVPQVEEPLENGERPDWDSSFPDDPSIEEGEMDEDEDEDVEKPDESPAISAFSLFEEEESSPTLGESDGEDKEPSGDPEVGFAAPVAGLYKFNLYDADGNFIKTYDYIVPFGVYPGSLTLGVVPEDNFKVRGTTKMALTYQPQMLGKSEVVTITLPPYFRLATEPVSTGDYTVTSTKGTSSSPHIALPTSYYTADANAAILLANTSSATDSQQIILTLNPSVTQMISMTFTIYVADYPGLSDMMVKYGTNPDKIPLKTIARATSPADGNLEIDEIVHTGTSRLTNESGTTPFDSQMNYPYAGSTYSLQQNYYEYLRPYYYHYLASSTSARYGANIDSWHYPISDMKIYYPLPDGVTFRGPNYPADDPWPEEIVDGKRYAVVEIAPGSGQSFTDISKSFIIDFYSGKYAQYWGIHHDEAVQGTVLTFGEAFMSYTYMGATRTKETVYNFSNITLPSFYTREYYNFSTTEAGSSGTDDRSRERLQGKADEITFTLDNSYQSNLSPTYENATYEIDFPYEVRPTSVTYSTGENGYDTPGTSYSPAGQRRDIYPSKITYYVEGSATPKTITIAAGQKTVDFPAADHVVKVVFHYDLIPSASRFTYRFSMQNGTTDSTGAALPSEANVAITYALKTADGMRVEQYGTSSPSRKTFSLSSTISYKLVGLGDGLRFGSIKMSTGSSGNKNVVRLPLLGRYDKTYGYYWTGSYAYQHDYPWQIMLKKSTAQMQDYENVVISIAPKTASDAAAMSKMTRLYVNGLTPGTQVEKFEVVYKTNLNSSWQALTNSSTYYYDFALPTGEYLTAVEIRLGTLYGNKMTATLLSYNSYDSGEMVYSGSSYYYHYITPYFDDKPTAFTGSADERTIMADENCQLVATISTTTPAQHINAQAAGVFYNNTSTGNILLEPSHGAKLTQQTESSSTNWSFGTGMAVYQNSSFSFRLNNAQVYDNPAYSEYYKQYPKDGDYEIKHQLYLEANSEFEVTGVTGFSLVSVTPVAGKSTKLYLFEGIFNKPQSYYDIQAYVRPDAKVNMGVPVLENAGLSLDGFVQEKLTPTSGSGAYYLSYPYFRFEINDTNPGFPAEWAVTATNQHRIITDSVTKISIDMLLLDKVTLKPTVMGGIKDPGVFQDHEKAQLGVWGFMSNATPSLIPKYEALYTLPRKGVDTLAAKEDGTEGTFANDFDLYLSGPVEFGIYGRPLPDNLKITYYNSGGTEVNITSSSSQSQLRSVTSIRVYFENFVQQETEALFIPLNTAETKTGTNIADMSSYIGAASRKGNAVNPIPSTEPFTYTQAGEHVFTSYDLVVNVGLDTTEDGQKNAALAGLIDVSVYYKDGLTTKLLETKTAGSTHTFKVNSDVKEITAVPTSGNEAKYVLTVAKTGDPLTDSDFLMDGTPLAVTMSDVTSKTTDTKYDAVFIKTPYMRNSADVNLAIGNSTTVVPDLRYQADDGTINTIARPFYTISFGAAADTTIATVEPTTGKITGLKKGTTTYVITITNRLGMTFTKTGTIKVSADYIASTSATIKNAFETGSTFINTTDRFSFKIWTDDPASPVSVTNVHYNGNVTSMANTIEKGEKHYIKQDDLSGYVNTGFTVLIDGAATTVTAEGSGVYSFTVPKTATSVAVTALNRTVYVQNGATIQKKFDTGSVKLSTGDTFSFQVWTTATIGSEKAITAVSDTTAKTASGIFERGAENFIKEDAKTGYVSTGFTITADGTPLSVTQKGDGSYAFTVPANCATLTVLANNRNTFVQSGATIKKAFDTGSVKINTGDTFSFKVWTDATVSAKKSVTGVTETAKSASGIFEAGAKNYIQEDALTGYVSTGFTVKADDVALAVTAESDGSYSFTVPAATAKLEVAANNKNTHVEGSNASIRKAMESGSSLVLPADTFSFQFWTDATVTAKKSIAGVTTGAGTSVAGKFERGVKNYIQEDDKLGYISTGYTVVADGTSLTVKDETGGVYSFTVPANCTSLVITATNKNSHVQDGATIKKTFDAGSVNLGTDTFSFQVWTDATVAAKKPITAVSETAKSVPGIFSTGVKNYIQEDAKTGYVSTGYTVVANGTALTVTDETGGVYSFTVPAGTTTLTITAKNRNTMVSGDSAKIKKEFATGNSNLGTDTFDFEVWTDATVSAKKTITGIGEALVSVPGNFERGVKNYIQEKSKVGYASKGFTVKASGTALTLTDEGSGVYSFVIPAGASTLEIAAVNENTSVYSATLRADFTPGNVLLSPTDTFSYKAWTAPASKKAITGVTSTTAKAVSDTFLKGAKNYIQADDITGYRNAGFTVKADGVALTVTKESDGSYSFTVPANCATLEIIALTENTHVSGNGNATITKEFAAGNIKLNPGDTFSFQAWTAATVSAKKSISGVSDTATTDVATIFEKGVKNYIQEDAATGYRSAGFRVKADNVALTVTKEGSAYVFTLPADVTKLEIVAVNENTHVSGTDSATIKVEFTTGNVKLKPTDTFNYQAWTVPASKQAISDVSDLA
ncbi:MAG: hypothetical protein ACK5LX_13245, partial [Oscillospiraceae bacterium]